MCDKGNMEMGLNCPYCHSDDYEYICTTDADESSVCIMCKCRKCGKSFDALYSFMYYEDEEGHIIDGDD